MTLAGWQMEDVTSPAQALDLVSRQKGLDFPSGRRVRLQQHRLLPALVDRRARVGPGPGRVCCRADLPAGRHARDALHGRPRGRGAAPRDRVRAVGHRLSRRAVQLGATRRRRRPDVDCRPAEVGRQFLRAGRRWPGPRPGACRHQAGWPTARPSTTAWACLSAPIAGCRRCVTAARGRDTAPSSSGSRLQKTSVMVLCNVATANAGRANRVADVVYGAFTEPAPSRVRRDPDCAR